MFSHYYQEIKKRCSERDSFWGLILTSLLINVLALMVPLVLLQTYDRIIPNHAMGTLAMLISAVAVTLVFEIILKVIRSVISSWSDARYEHITSVKAFKKIVSTKSQLLAHQGSGKLLDDMNAVSSLKDFYTGQLITSLVDVPFVVIFLGIMIYLAGWLVLIPIAVIAFYIVFILRASKELKEQTELRQETDDKRTNFVVQVLGKIHTLKSSAMEAAMLRRYERLQEQTAAVDHDLAEHSGGKTAISQFASQITVVLTVSVGAYLVLANLLSMGSLAACIFLANRVLQPVSRLSGMLARLQSVDIAEDRLTKIMAYPSEGTGDDLDSSILKGDIKFDDVTIGFSGNPTFLQHVNMDIKAGECISIQGESLSGKSTILKMMQGLIVPMSGEVTFSGHKFDEFEPNMFRQQVAYIDQYAKIFEGTLIDNMTMFRGGDNIDRAKKLASIIGLDNYIMRLPKGYQTILGNTSADILPRGIKQRIALVRILCVEPRILLFDEANTAMDIQADQALIGILRQLKGQLTMVFVSHRPSLLKLADKHYEIKAGGLHVKH